MKHARDDYDRIQDPLGLIPDDEPVFLLRAQDKHAAHIVRVYAKNLDLQGGDPTMVAMCLKHADEMDKWPKKKQPDLPLPTEGEVKA